MAITAYFTVSFFVQGCSSDVPGGGDVTIAQVCTDNDESVEPDPDLIAECHGSDTSEKPAGDCDDGNPCTLDTIGITCVNDPAPKYTLCGGDINDAIHGECDGVGSCTWTDYRCIHGKDYDVCGDESAPEPNVCLNGQCCFSCVIDGACAGDMSAC